MRHIDVVVDTPQYLYETLRNQFEDSKQVERASFAIAGFNIDISSTSQRRFDLAQAFAPATIAEPRKADLNVYVIVGSEDPFSGQDQRRPPRPHFYGATPEMDCFFHWHPSCVTALNLTKNEIVCWIPDERRLPNYFRAKPLLFTLATWLSYQGLYIIHAALVAKEGRGYLICGPGGAGKSTLCLRLLGEQGYACLGDDIVALGEDTAGRFVGHRLFSSLSLEPQHAATFALMCARGIAAKTADDKMVLFASNRETPSATPIDGLLFPMNDALPPEAFQPLAKGDAYKRMTPSCLELPSIRWNEDLIALGNLVRAVPCFAIRFDSGSALDERLAPKA